MKKALFVLVVLLLSAYCYAQDDKTIDTTGSPDYTKDIRPGADTGMGSESYDSQDIYSTDEEDADRYDYGTAERELNVQDYGVGDLGEESLE